MSVDLLSSFVRVATGKTTPRALENLAACGMARLLQDLAACHVEETNTSSEGSWKQQGTLRGSRDDVLLREFEAWPFALKGKGKATGKGSYIRFQTEIHDIGIYQWRKRNSALAVDRLVDFTCMYKYIYIHM